MYKPNKRRYSRLAQKITPFHNHPKISDRVKKCLLDNGSLIQYLEDKIAVKISPLLKNQRWNKPCPAESKILRLRSGGYGFIRETLLISDKQPLVFARTVIPPNTLPHTPKLTYFGEKPLGHLLFSNKYTYRKTIAIGTLKKLPTVNGQTPCQSTDGVIWGRRSIFYIKSKPLLLTEILLPETIQCLNRLK